MITDADVKKLKGVFATKYELKHLEKKLGSNMQKNTDEIIQAVGEMFDGLDEKLKHKPDNDDLSTQQRQIDNHETRIGDLEAKPN